MGMHGKAANLITGVPSLVECMTDSEGASPAAGRAVTSPAGRGSPTRRHLSLFDAVAGRATHLGFAADLGSAKVSLSAAVSPEGVLFRRKDAPERDPENEPENDPYWADRELPSSARLPESDLLKAVHSYAADFYSRMDGGQISTRSMNETALLALGVLLEESMAQVLGDTGDLALIEGEPATPEEQHENDQRETGPGQSQGIERETTPRRADADMPRASKKRRLDRTESSV